MTSDDRKTEASENQNLETLLKEAKTTIDLERIINFPWSARQALLALSTVAADVHRSMKEQGIFLSKDTGTLVLYWVGRIVALRNTPNTVLLGKVHDFENQSKDVAHSFNTSGYLKSALADAVLRKKAIDESPWPFDHERCSVVKIKELIAINKAMEVGEVEKLKKRGGYRFKSYLVTLDTALLGLVIPNTERETPYLMRMKRPDDFETLRETSLHRRKSSLNFYATWRKSGWAFTMPVELTEDEPSELLSHLEIRKKIKPPEVSFTKGMHTFYNRYAFEWFANNSPLNHIFYLALLEFMAVAAERRDLVIPNAPKYSPVPPEERKTKIRWTPDEIRILTQVFSPDENGTRTSVTSDWDWENVFKYLQPHHRSKVEVQRKIASMNVQLKKSLQVRGVWTEEAKKEFARKRLGQLTRVVK